VALNVTVTAPQTAGFVSAAAAAPNGSSSLNFVAGQTVANLVISKIAPDGTVSIYNRSGGTVQLIADVQGYDNPATAGNYHTLSPVRLLDTRVGSATNPVRAAVPAGGTLKVAVAGISGSPVPAGATAVALNVTVTAPQTAGFVSAADAAPNGSSSLNFVAGQTVANLVISKIAPDGTVSIYNGSGGTLQLVADVQGYNTPTDWGAGWMALSPVRLLDTRVGTATNPVRAAVPAGSTLKVAVAGISGSPVPAGATAVALNVTVTAPRTAGFVSVSDAAPNGSSSLNFVAGQTVANLVISKIAPDGTVSIHNGSGGTLQLVADVQGYNK